VSILAIATFSLASAMRVDPPGAFIQTLFVA